MLHESKGFEGYSYKKYLDSGTLYEYKQKGITTQLSLNMARNCCLEEFNFELASLWKFDALNIGVYHSTTI